MVGYGDEKFLAPLAVSYSYNLMVKVLSVYVMCVSCMLKGAWHKS